MNPYLAIMVMILAMGIADAEAWDSYQPPQGYGNPYGYPSSGTRFNVQQYSPEGGRYTYGNTNPAPNGGTRFNAYTTGPDGTSFTYGRVDNNGAINSMTIQPDGTTDFTYGRVSPR
jgi:hypothetical protein